jgi:hypothetical protein
MKKLFFAHAVLLTILLSFQTASAAEDYAGNIGAQFGLSVPDLSGSTARTIVGLQGTAKLGSEWGLGAYYLTSSKNETISSVATDFNYQLYGVKGTYHFEGDARGAYFGALVGISKVHIGQVDTSPTNFGVLAGYDKMLGSVVSLGGELSYINVGSSSATYNNVNVSVNSFNTLNFLAAVKFWF